ncbi:hypothetical protein K502DRAFT_362481 [Neoconidiobolus thromboides FSU 785]|nr:hypothetical protein K502DRAFT_362481 [Neoconidiobolus thromboides FSU 785]
MEQIQNKNQYNYQPTIPLSELAIKLKGCIEKESRYNDELDSKDRHTLAELRQKLDKHGVAKIELERVEQSISKAKEYELLKLIPEDLASNIYNLDSNLWNCFLDQERTRNGNFITNNRPCPFILGNNEFILKRLVDLQVYISNSLTHLLLNLFIKKEIELNSSITIGNQLGNLLSYPFRYFFANLNDNANNKQLFKTINVLLQTSKILLAKYKDFNGFASIIASLTHPAIMRVFNVIKLPKEINGVIKEYHSLIRADKNYHNYFDNNKYDTNLNIPWILPYVNRIDVLVKGYVFKSPFMENNKFHVLFTFAGQDRFEDLLAKLPKHTVKHNYNNNDINNIILSHWLLSLPYLSNDQLMEISYKVLNSYHSDIKYDCLHSVPSYLSLPSILSNGMNKRGNKAKEENMIKATIESDKNDLDNELSEIEFPKIPSKVKEYEIDSDVSSLLSNMLLGNELELESELKELEEQLNGIRIDNLAYDYVEENKDITQIDQCVTDGGSIQNYEVISSDRSENGDGLNMSVNKVIQNSAESGPEIESTEELNVIKSHMERDSRENKSAAKSRTVENANKQDNNSQVIDNKEGEINDNASEPEIYNNTRANHEEGLEADSKEICSQSDSELYNESPSNFNIKRINGKKRKNQNTINHDCDFQYKYNDIKEHGKLFTVVSVKDIPFNNNEEYIGNSKYEYSITKFIGGNPVISLKDVDFN